MDEWIDYSRILKLPSEANIIDLEGKFEDDLEFNQGDEDDKKSVSHH